MKTYTPPKNTILLWQIRASVMLTALALIVFILVNVFYAQWRILLLIEIVILFAWAALVLAYIPSYFKRYSISVSEKAIIIKSGVFLLHERIMPQPLFIYSESYKTPLSSLLGLSGLVFKASKITILCAELEIRDAKQIKEWFR